MADQLHPIRECENCHAAMKPMGELPAMGAKPLIKVFRCYECDNIASDVIASKPVSIPVGRRDKREIEIG